MHQNRFLSKYLIKKPASVLEETITYLLRISCILHPSNYASDKIFHVDIVPGLIIRLHEMQVADEETRELKLEDLVSLKYTTRIDDSDQLVYHIDYHGVTTHPTPTPKHPRP